MSRSRACPLGLPGYLAQAPAQRGRPPSYVKSGRCRLTFIRAAPRGPGVPVVGGYQERRMGAGSPGRGSVLCRPDGSTGSPRRRGIRVAVLHDRQHVHTFHACARRMSGSEFQNEPPPRATCLKEAMRLGGTLGRKRRGHPERHLACFRLLTQAVELLALEGIGAD
jgi:hypothetical protein